MNRHHREIGGQGDHEEIRRGITRTINGRRRGRGPLRLHTMKQIGTRPAESETGGSLEDGRRTMRAMKMTNTMAPEGPVGRAM